jgi:pimeloyl-ACP methyl ester carboxylesterase
MKIKNFILVFSALMLGALACRLFVPGTSTPESPASPQPVVTGAPATFTPAKVDMVARLKELGGQTCKENPDFTCVTIQVPLDHFDPSNSKTLDIVFAVAPAHGERYGMYIQAFPGGPGGEGIATGTLSFFSDSVLQHYDIVYFDQRGVGLSHPISCPVAYAKDFMYYLDRVDHAGLEGYDTPPEQQAVINEAHTFVEECIAEIGPANASILGFFGTNQVAEDLETFRQTIGDDKFMLYGVSYGTAVAETYAAAHPDHLSGLILDGTIDLTRTGEEDAFAQDKAFNKVLVATLNACDTDQYCAADLGGNTLAVYDDLATRVSKNPPTYEFPLPSGEKVTRTFTFDQLEYTAAYQMYSLIGRMLFLRALAAAKTGDMVPMARLLYQQAHIDPATFNYVGDPTFSDTMFYDVLCTDDSFYSGTPQQRIAQVIKAGQASNGTVPRLDGNVYTGLDCAYWPTSPSKVVRQKPLVAEGVPSFVLDATLDPATPFEEGQSVFEHLADGYLLYVNGGQHSIFGWGYDCPDTNVTNFLVDGKVPDQRKTLCDWGQAVISPYVPRIQAQASDYANPLQILASIDNEIQLEPEFLYSSLEENTSVACPDGGSFTFGPSSAGVSYSFDNCAYLKGFAITGSGSFDTVSGVFTINVQVSGDQSGTLTYVHNHKNNSVSVTGEYGGQTINMQE